MLEQLFLVALVKWLIGQNVKRQDEIANRLAWNIIQAWKDAIDFDDVRQTAPAFARVATPLIREARIESQLSADEMYRGVRQLSQPEAAPLPRLVLTGSGGHQVSARPDPLRPALDDLQKSIDAKPLPEPNTAAQMLVVGPRMMLAEMPARESVAMPSSAARVAKKAVEIALDGGRDLVSEYIDLDHEALGWARLAEPDACAWCALLAARGPVYKSDAFQGASRRGNTFESSWIFGDDQVQALVHNNCRCTIVPVFSGMGMWDDEGYYPQAAEWREMYKRVAVDQGLYGKKAINAFRREYERGTGIIEGKPVKGRINKAPTNAQAQAGKAKRPGADKSLVSFASTEDAISAAGWTSSEASDALLPGIEQSLKNENLPEPLRKQLLALRKKLKTLK